MNPLHVLSLSASLLVIASTGMTQTMAQTTGMPPASPGQGAGQGPKEMPAPAAPQTTPQQAVVRLDDFEFVAKATAGNRYEIEAARIAVAKATGPKVKDLAGMLVKDHGEILEDLAKAAREAGVSLPAEAKPDADKRARLDALAAKSGAGFDALFVADMKKAHDDSLALLTVYMQVGKNPKLQAWAAKWLPTVQRHRDVLKEM